MSILELTAVELGKKIKDKEITVVEATKVALEQIKAVESDVHGYVSYDEESALKRAEEVQKGIEFQWQLRIISVQRDIQQHAVLRS